MAIHELFPYLCVNDANAAIEFYCKVFEVKEIFRLTEPSGRIGHAELDFHNGAILMGIGGVVKTGFYRHRAPGPARASIGGPDQPRIQSRTRPRTMLQSPKKRSWPSRSCMCQVPKLRPSTFSNVD